MIGLRSPLKKSDALCPAAATSGQNFIAMPRLHPLTERLVHFIGRQSKPLVAVFGFALIALLGITDYWFTSFHITFIVFYLAPIFIIAWFGGWRLGLASAILCSIVNLAIDLSFPAEFIQPGEIYFNSTAAIVVYLVAARVIAALHAAMAHEKELARTDYVTGAANRRAFFEALDLELYRARRRTRPLTIIMLDLDDFKGVNDQLGHAAGDALLKAAVDTLRQVVRVTDLVARLGGDEFAILLPETAADAAQKVVLRLQKDLAETMRHSSWPVTFSMGLATFNRPPESPDSAMKDADDLMYQAKRNGKNKIEQQVFQ